jgi:hypothetical protein
MDRSVDFGGETGSKECSHKSPRNVSVLPAVHWHSSWFQLRIGNPALLVFAPCLCPLRPLSRRFLLSLCWATNFFKEVPVTSAASSLLHMSQSSMYYVSAAVPLFTHNTSYLIICISLAARVGANAYGFLACSFFARPFWEDCWLALHGSLAKQVALFPGRSR